MIAEGDGFAFVTPLDAKYGFDRTGPAVDHERCEDGDIFRVQEFDEALCDDVVRSKPGDPSGVGAEVGDDSFAELTQDIGGVLGEQVEAARGGGVVVGRAFAAGRGGVRQGQIDSGCAHHGVSIGRAAEVSP